MNTSEYQILIDRGLTTVQMGKEINLSKSQVKRQLQKLGLHTQHWNPHTPINKEQLEEKVNRGLSSYAIAKEFNRSQTAIRYWLEKYNLKTNCIRMNSVTITPEGKFKVCKQCGQNLELTSSNFYIQLNGKFHAWCKKCNNTITLNRQRKLKLDAIAYKGGKCELCGYNKYVGAMDFHHIDPNKKYFTISNYHTYSWERIQNELDKCIILCRNCHAEVHWKMVGVSGNAPEHGTNLVRSGL